MSNSLTVIEQKKVPFYHDQITAVRVEDGTVYVPIRPICELLGVDWASQRKRINRDIVLAKQKMSVVVTTTDSVSDGSRRPKTSHMIALPLDYLNGWLFGMNASRVKDSVRDQLVRYQTECYRVLFEAFQTGDLSTEGDDVADMLKNAHPETVEAYQIAKAVFTLARRQLVSEIRLNDHEERLQILEARSRDSARQIDTQQASMISQAVKVVALELGKNTGRNEFGGVYGELYRRYQISSYQELPSVKFQDAMQFLRDWWQSLTDEDTIPF